MHERSSHFWWFFWSFAEVKLIRSENYLCKTRSLNAHPPKKAAHNRTIFHTATNRHFNKISLPHFTEYRQKKKKKIQFCKMMDKNKEHENNIILFVSNLCHIYPSIVIQAENRNVMFYASIQAT